MKRAAIAFAAATVGSVVVCATSQAAPIAPLPLTATSMTIAYMQDYPYRWQGRFYRYRWHGRYYNHRYWRHHRWYYY